MGWILIKFLARTVKDKRYFPDQPIYVGTMARHQARQMRSINSHHAFPINLFSNKFRTTARTQSDVYWQTLDWYFAARRYTANVCFMHNQCGQSPAKIPRLTMQGLLLLCHWECFIRVLSHSCFCVSLCRWVTDARNYCAFYAF